MFPFVINQNEKTSLLLDFAIMSVLNKKSMRSPGPCRPDLGNAGKVSYEPKWLQGIPRNMKITQGLSSLLFSKHSSIEMRSLLRDPKHLEQGLAPVSTPSTFDEWRNDEI